MSFIDISGVNTLQVGQRNPNIPIHQVAPTAEKAESSPNIFGEDSVDLGREESTEGQSSISSLISGLGDAFSEQSENKDNQSSLDPGNGSLGSDSKSSGNSAQSASLGSDSKSSQNSAQSSPNTSVASNQNSSQETGAASNGNSSGSKSTSTQGSEPKSQSSSKQSSDK